jgi:hypothetical protein
MQTSFTLNVNAEAIGFLKQALAQKGGAFRLNRTALGVGA